MAFGAHVPVRACSFETGIDVGLIEDVSVGEDVDHDCFFYGLSLAPVCEALKERRLVRRDIRFIITPNPQTTNTKEFVCFDILPARKEELFQTLGLRPDFGESELVVDTGFGVPWFDRKT